MAWTCTEKLAEARRQVEGLKAALEEQERIIEQLALRPTTMIQLKAAPAVNPKFSDA